MHLRAGRSGHVICGVRIPSQGPSAVTIGIATDRNILVQEIGSSDKFRTKNIGSIDSIVDVQAVLGTTGLG